jgi:CDP-4-dehydro-6-deoxyglucose reductase
VAGSTDYPVRKMPTRVQSIRKAAPDVAILTLQLPANEALAYRAGQYIEFLLKDGKRRAYSIANAPSYEGPLELHIRYMPGGVFTEHVFHTMKERDILRFEGPLGTFFLREDSDKPIVLLASGTGFAPVKALVEHLMHLKSTRKVSLYWGGRRPQDLYMDELCQAWAATLPDFSYVPVISDALPEDHWQGRTGFVHEAVMQDIPDLSGYQVYACGAPVMVDAARGDYAAQRGLPADEFYADAFTSEADLAQP